MMVNILALSDTLFVSSLLFPVLGSWVHIVIASVIFVLKEQFISFSCA